MFCDDVDVFTRRTGVLTVAMNGHAWPYVAFATDVVRKHRPGLDPDAFYLAEVLLSRPRAWP